MVQRTLFDITEDTEQPEELEEENPVITPIFKPRMPGGDCAFREHDRCSKTGITKDLIFDDELK